MTNGILPGHADDDGATVIDGVLRTFRAPPRPTDSVGSADTAIGEFLAKYSNYLRLDEIVADVNDFDGGSMLRRRWQQRHNGLPVVRSLLQVVASVRRSRVLSAFNALDYDLEGVPQPPEAQSIDDVWPTIERLFDSFRAAELRGSRLAYLRDTRRPPTQHLPRALRGLLTAGQDPDDEVHLVWEARVETEGPLDAFQVLVDAVSGELLYLETLSRYATARLLAYIPDPVTQSNDPTLDEYSGNAELVPYQHKVRAKVDDPAAIGDLYELRGDWVHCDDVELPYVGQPGEATPTFKYLPEDPLFRSANAYYWLDRIARYLQTRGISDFDTSVEAVVVDAQADDNRFLQLAVGPTIICDAAGVSGATDMSVLIHEYTHGVVDWLGSKVDPGFEHSLCDSLPAIYRDRFNPNGHHRTAVFPWDHYWGSERRLDRVEGFGDASFYTSYINDSELLNSMLGTAFWDCFLGIGGESESRWVRKWAADEMITTLMLMAAVTDSGYLVPPKEIAVRMSEEVIEADEARTGGLYRKVFEDAFLRRGLRNEEPIDLYIRDSIEDTGEHPSRKPLWWSPDIWVRNNPPAADNPELGHQDPISGQANYVYVRVHNRGEQTAEVNTFGVEAFVSVAGTGKTFPTDYQSLGTQPVAQAVPGGGSVRVGPFAWIPPSPSFNVMLAVVHGLDDPSVPSTLLDPVRRGRIVRFDNNVAQRNVLTFTSVPGGEISLFLIAQGDLETTTDTLIIDAEDLLDDANIEVRTLRRVVDDATLTNLEVWKEGAVWTKLRTSGGRESRLEGFGLERNGSVRIELKITLSNRAQHLVHYPVAVSHEQDGEVVGRLLIDVLSVAEFEGWVFGNPRSSQMHVSSCPHWRKTLPRHKIPFRSISDAEARGFNGCAFCLPHLDRR